MKIISGKSRGRSLKGINIEGTRPTMDRVKESMFASIQNYIKDSIVLDLFAGSGSLGIEALSNGAETCYFVDNNKIAIDTINKNINGIDNTIVLKKDYKDLELNKFLNKMYNYDLCAFCFKCVSIYWLNILIINNTEVIGDILGK